MQRTEEPSVRPLTLSNDQYLQPVIANFCVGRIGGISSSCLDDLVLSQTQQHSIQLQEYEICMHALAPHLEEYLYRLVPQIASSNKQLSRRLLAMKRHIHNVRLWEQAQADINAILPFLKPEEQEELLHWYDLGVKRASLLRVAAEQYQQEVAEAGKALQLHLTDYTLCQGLVLANQDVYRAILQTKQSYDEEHWQPGSRLARTCLSYFTRAAMKTSPFSTFTQICLANFTTDLQSCVQDQNTPQTQVVRLAQSLAFTWLMGIARDPEFAFLLSFEPNQSIVLLADDPHHISVLTSEYVYYGDLAGRNERIVKRRFESQKLGRLGQFLVSRKVLSYPALLETILTNGQFPNPQKTVNQFLDMQLIRPVAPYRCQEAKPLLALITLLEQTQSSRGKEVARLMGQVQSYGDALTSADPAARLAILQHLRESSAIIFEKLGMPLPTWLPNVTLVYEDVRFSKATIMLPAQIQQDLRQFTTTLRPHFVRTRMYDYLYQFFLKSYGTEGEVSNIQLFLQQFLAQPDAYELTTRVKAEDWYTQNVDSEGRDSIPAGASGTPPACTLFFQVAADDEAALARGDYRIVINQINSGQGALLGRFHQLFQENGNPLTERIHHWLQDLHPGKKLVELPVAGDWNNLQSSQGILDQILQWPAELSTRENEQVIHLEDLRLRINKNDATLYLVDSTGQTIAPSYLGIIPAHFSPTILHLFLQILDPWLLSWKTVAHQKSASSEEQIHFLPRQESGRIVLQRASWYVPFKQFPCKLKEEDNFTFYLRLETWRKEHGIPDEVFAARADDRVSLDSRKRKPLWIHFSSPHTLELLIQLISKDQANLLLTEVFPSRQQHWVTGFSADNDKKDISQRFVNEFMVLLRWPMPFPQGCQAVSHAFHKPKNSWLYFKIYPQADEALDAVVRQLILPLYHELLCKHEKVHQWFYLRFSDEQGSHVRLRLCVPFGVEEEIQNLVQAWLRERLATLEIPSSQAAKETDQPRAFPCVDTDLYKPEVEKYAGLEGIVLAERLFHASSEAALQLLSIEKDDEVHFRQKMALICMQDLLRVVGMKGQAFQELLRFYLWYWTGQDGLDAHEWRAQIWARAEQEYKDVERQLQESRQPTRIQHILSAYHQAIAPIVQTCKDTLPPYSYSLRQFCFDHMHLMNNRLGISLADEGYLAALLSLLQYAEPMNGSEE